MATGDITAVSVNTDGWSVDVTIEGWSAKVNTVTFANWTNRYTIGDVDNDSGNMTFTVVSEGYSGGVLGTITRTIYGTKVVRKAYPNDSDIDEAASASDMVVRVALSERIYNDDKNGGAGTSGTDPTVTFAAGWATDGGDSTNAVTDLAVTNNSTVDYPKVIGCWDWQNLRGGRRRMIADFNNGFIAFHMYGIDQVTLSAIGATSANDVSNSVTSMTAVQATASQLYYPSFLSSTPLSGFTQGEQIDLRAICYPKVGDADSILDTNNDSDTNNRCLGKSQEWVMCDKDYAVDANGHVSAGMVSSLVAFVDHANGNDSTGVVGTASAAAAAPYQGQGEAIKDGAMIVYVKNSGTPLLVKGWGNNLALTYYPEITEDPNDTGVYLSRDTNSDDNYRQPYFCYTNIGIRHTANQGWLDGENGDRRVLFDGVTFDNQVGDTVGLGYQSKDCMFLNCTGMGNDDYQDSGATRNAYIFFGCKWGSGDGGTNSFYNAIANKSNGHQVSFFGKGTSNPAPSQTNQLIINNELMDKTITAGNENIIRAGDNENMDNWVIAGNIMECTSESGPSGPVMWLSGDSSTTTCSNVLVMRNTTVGQRWNVFYNDTGAAATLHENISIWGNANRSYNIKSDTFASSPDGARTGNWATMWCVNCHDNIHDGSASSAFTGEYDGIRSSFELSGDLSTYGELGYENETSNDLASGGAGDYTPASGSVLRSQSVPNNDRFPIDLYGTTFSGDYIGAVGVAAAANSDLYPLAAACVEQTAKSLILTIGE